METRKFRTFRGDEGHAEVVKFFQTTFLETIRGMDEGGDHLYKCPDCDYTAMVTLFFQYLHTVKLYN